MDPGALLEQLAAAGVTLAVAGRDGMQVQPLALVGDRNRIRHQTVNEALRLLDLAFRRHNEG